MQFLSPQDFTGDGTAHPLSDIPGLTCTKCKWFQVIGIAIANSSIPGRLGDSGVALNVVSPVALGRGTEIPQGGGQVAYPIALMSDLYDLTKIYYVLAAGDVAQILVAV